MPIDLTITREIRNVRISISYLSKLSYIFPAYPASIRSVARSIIYIISGLSSSSQPNLDSRRYSPASFKNGYLAKSLPAILIEDKLDNKIQLYYHKYSITIN